MCQSVQLLARPVGQASYPVLVHRVAALLHACFRPCLATSPLRFAYPSESAIAIYRKNRKKTNFGMREISPSSCKRAKKSGQPLLGSPLHSSFVSFDLFLFHELINVNHQPCLGSPDRILGGSIGTLADSSRSVRPSPASTTLPMKSRFTPG